MNSCPYLGVKYDQKTTIRTPDPRNCCHRARPIVPVSESQQYNFCLSPEFHHCPIYKSEKKAPLPLMIAHPGYVRRQARNAILGVSLAVILLVAGVVFANWNSLPETGAAAAQLPAQAGLTQTAASLAAGLATASPTSTQIAAGAAVSGTATARVALAGTAAAETAAATALTATARAACEPPAGWAAYTLQLGDSLYSLSQIYDISLVDLRAGNCLAENAQVQAGDSIFLPPLKTATATFTPSSTATLTLTPTHTPTIRVVLPTARPSPTRTREEPDEEEEPRPQPTNTPRPPTQEPPTQAPPTQAPPTQQPSTPTSAPPPPPTVEPPPPPAEPVPTGQPGG